MFTVKLLKEIVDDIPEEYNDKPIIVLTEDDNLQPLEIIVDQHRFYCEYLEDDDSYGFII